MNHTDFVVEYYSDSRPSTASIDVTEHQAAGKDYKSVTISGPIPKQREPGKGWYDKKGKGCTSAHSAQPVELSRDVDHAEPSVLLQSGHC
jgi:hypothetical protein